MPSGPQFGDGHLEVGENLQQEGLEFLVSLVHFVHKKNRSVRGLERLEDGARFQEALGKEEVPLVLDAPEGLFQGVGALEELVQLFP